MFSADRINTITNGIDGTMSQTLGYDELDRLRTVTSTADNETFNYGADGNRTSGVVNGVWTTYTVSLTSNRLGDVFEILRWDNPANRAIAETTIWGHACHACLSQNRNIEMELNS